MKKLKKIKYDRNKNMCFIFLFSSNKIIMGKIKTNYAKCFFVLSNPVFGWRRMERWRVILIKISYLVQNFRGEER